MTEPYADQGERVLADVRAFLARSAELVELRAQRAASKGGRVLSEPNTERLEGLLAGLEASATDVRALLDTAQPVPAETLEDVILAAKRALSLTQRPEPRPRQTFDSGV